MDDNVTCDYVERTPRGDVQCGNVATTGGRCTGHVGDEQVPAPDGNGKTATPGPVEPPADRVEHARELWAEALALETRLGAMLIQYELAKNELMNKQRQAIEAYEVAMRRLRNACKAPAGAEIDWQTGRWRLPVAVPHVRLVAKPAG